MMYTGSVEDIHILQKVEIWTGVTDASLTDSHLKDSATQLLIKYKSGALVTQQVLNLTLTDNKRERKAHS